MIEEYYTLAVIGKGGIGTPHMDGNTRLCTATAAAAFGESFGMDGQPGSYADIDWCDALLRLLPASLSDIRVSKAPVNDKT